MSRRPRRKINNIVTPDTVYFEKSEESHLFFKHREIFESWLDGDSIWKICTRFNIRVPDAEELVRYGAIMVIKSLKKHTVKTGSKNSRKKQPST
jgi:hypothetical protein